MSKTWSEYDVPQLDSMIAKATELRKKQLEALGLSSQFLEAAITARFWKRLGKDRASREEVRVLVQELLAAGLDEAADRQAGKSNIRDHRGRSFDFNPESVLKRMRDAGATV